MIKVLLLDAANTIIHKPDLWIKLQHTLNTFGYNPSLVDLKRNHKLLSEYIHFPDRTDENFYNHFNSELLFSFGIIPNEIILKEMFTSCSYLPWHSFQDTEILCSIKLPIAILSNFNSGLGKLLNNLFPTKFISIIASEDEKIRKPDVRFFQLSLEKLNLLPNEILYIGDSIKLDMKPAIEVGMNAFLIDRDNYFKEFSNRISSFNELPKLIKNINS